MTTKHMPWILPLAGAALGAAMSAGAFRFQVRNVVEDVKVLKVFKEKVGERLAGIEEKGKDTNERVKRIERLLDRQLLRRLP